MLNETLETVSHQSILIHIGPLNLLGIAARQNHGASQHVEVLLTKQQGYVIGFRFSFYPTNNIRPLGEWDVQINGRRNNEQGSAVSEALDKPTWVLILIAQMERISK